METRPGASPGRAGQSARRRIITFCLTASSFYVMTTTHDHEHDFVPIKIGPSSAYFAATSELRQRCRYCTAIRLMPHPGDSDTELAARIMLGAKSNMPLGIWMTLVARMMQREYERETGLPAFAGSEEYATWLRHKKTP